MANANLYVFTTHIRKMTIKSGEITFDEWTTTELGYRTTGFQIWKLSFKRRNSCKTTNRTGTNSRKRNSFDRKVKEKLFIKKSFSVN